MKEDDKALKIYNRSFLKQLSPFEGWENRHTLTLSKTNVLFQWSIFHLVKMILTDAMFLKYVCFLYFFLFFKVPCSILSFFLYYFGLSVFVWHLLKAAQFTGSFDKFFSAERNIYTFYFVLGWGECIMKYIYLKPDVGWTSVIDATIS